MAVPRLVVVPKHEWLSHLQQERVEAWYHNHRLQAWGRRHLVLGALVRPLLGVLAPRAYSRQDDTGGPSSGDALVVRSDKWLLALLGVADLDAGRKLSWLRRDALLLVLHEYAHCMVRLDETGHAYPTDLRHYSHPNGWVAVKHAVRQRFPLNAFSGLLRWRLIPGDAALGGLAWLRAVSLGD